MKKLTLLLTLIASIAIAQTPTVTPLPTVRPTPTITPTPSPSPTPTPTPDSILYFQPESDSQRIAREVLVAPKKMRDALLLKLEGSVDKLWSSPNPQAVLDAIGPKGRDLFEINTKFAQLLGVMMAAEQDADGLARLSMILAKIPACTIDKDGRVTIDPKRPTENP